nr:MAG TPA: hypothetical protein [Caudoviricetes sp.]
MMSLMRLILRVDVIIYLQSYRQASGNLGLINRLESGTVEKIPSRYEPRFLVGILVHHDMMHDFQRFFSFEEKLLSHVRHYQVLLSIQIFDNFSLFQQHTSLLRCGFRAVSGGDGRFSLPTAVTFYVFNYKLLILFCQHSHSPPFEKN